MVDSIARVKHIRVTPQKARRVVALIKGKQAQEALAILKFAPQAASEPVYKLVESAIANAENNHNLDIDNLVVAEAFVGKNLVMKRFASRARGRSSRILKPFSEITIVVREAGEAA